MATAGHGRGAGAERAFALELPLEGEVVLGPDESRHLVRVRRVAAGDPVVLFDGRGTTVHGTLVSIDPRGAHVRVEGEAPDREPARAVIVAASPPEAGRADALVGALAELGTARWIPLLCERTPAGRAEACARRASRWERIRREAAKVNGRSRLLTIAPPMPLVAVLEAAPAALLLDPDPAAVRLAAQLPSEGELPWLLVGPEGGFTPAELDAAAARGVTRVRLGATALRVETAAMAAGALGAATA